MMGHTNLLWMTEKVTYGKECVLILRARYSQQVLQPIKYHLYMNKIISFLLFVIAFITTGFGNANNINSLSDEETKILAG